MSVINTNITSMIGQQNLNASKSALTTSMERLSSGLRINSAKDDAAGQAIANRMSSQITGLSQAQRNANDGISVAQTAEGALNQVNDNIQRIRELSVQAQNGTNSQDDLTSIQNEIGQRLNEINRISEETSFNGVKVLQENNSLNIQVGANDGEAIEIDLKKINAETLGLTGFNVDGQSTNNNAAGLEDIKSAVGENITVSGSGESTVYSLTTQNKALTASDVFANLSGSTVNYAGTNTGLSQDDATGLAADGGAYTYDAETDSFTYDMAGTATNNDNAASVASLVKPSSGSITATYSLGAGESIDVKIDSAGTITTVDGKALYIGEDGNLSQNNGGASDEATVDNLMDAFNDAKTSTGTTANFTTGGVLELTSGEQKGMKVTSTAAASGVGLENVRISAEDLVAASASSGTKIDATTSDSTAVDLYGDTVVVDGGDASDAADVRYEDSSQEGFQVTASASFDTTIYELDDGTFNSSQDGNGKQVYVDSEGGVTFDPKSEGGKTEDPLEVLDKALSDVDALRSDLGAIQNRFESAITNLSTTETNLSAARSRIEDADYAVEVANMTRAQILQQAGTSVLAQANQVPQSVLSLLG
ncbi:hypothetical protein TW86_20235 [Halomonas sp. S2151]|uniref:flagellin N-terminal helical domain-containing protein n=1 Tax=Halomonas sp. S2151 TaxID=579478 RepID=UPI0005F9EB36|nr:flagellin [Halomonas sp. S2151]KJZ05924.1 hypothetical protein TW86_20235 [Halomonas sp. S2151]